MEKCKVEGCERQKDIWRKGYCHLHYMRIRKHGSPHETGRLCGSQHPQYKHGLMKHPLYRTWAMMLRRCENPKDKLYKYYGGRGIVVCDRWHYITNFVEDMGSRPVGMTLDRKDNNGNYEPNNCRWATKLEQARNRGMVRLNLERAIEIRAARKNGESTETLSARFGVGTETIRRVLRNEVWVS